MKNKLTRSLVILAMGAALLPVTTQAQLKITEVESSEITSTPAKPDWFELTNLGTTPLDITGYRIDDDSKDPTKSVPLSGVTSIAAGQSVIFFEVAATPTFTVQNFRDWWSLDSSVPIGTYTGSGVGLGAGVNGDQVNIFASSTVGSPVIDGVVFGAATAGTSFSWDPTTQSLTASVLGVNGAFASADNGIGSPGIVAVASVPEPSTLSLLGLGIGGLLLRRFVHKNRK